MPESLAPLPDIPATRTMNTTHLTGLCAAILTFVSSSWAQGLVVKSGGERRSTRLLYTVGVKRPGEVYLHYGAAAWRESHGAEVVRKRDGRFRLGVGFWAALHTNIELELGGKRVPANIWYLGLHRSAAAEWSLTLMDSSKVARSGEISGATRDVKPDLEVPMQLERGLPVVKDLRLEFVIDKKKFGGGSLHLRWGEFRLSAPFHAAVVALKPRDEPAFRKLDPKRTVTTASGLQYEELRPGTGPRPTAKSKVEVHYVGWLTDGRRFDSSFLRHAPATFPVMGVIKGWQEGLQLMKAGAVFRMRIPPDLGYGKRGVGMIPAGATLEFWVELRAIK